MLRTFQCANVKRMAPDKVGLCSATHMRGMFRITIPRRLRRDRRNAPVGSVGFVGEPGGRGERMIWPDAGVVDRLSAMRDASAMRGPIAT